MRTFKVLLAILILLAAAGATTVIPMSVEELTKAASNIVEVDVVDSWSTWNPEHSLIYTYSRVRVARALKGGVEPEMIVQQLGGSSEGYTMKVAGVHALEKGEHAMLFLRPARANGGATWNIVGLMQGHFRIYAAGGKSMAGNGVQVPRVRTQGRAPVTLDSSSSATTASVTSTAPVPSPAGSMTVQELESRIRRVLEK